MLNDYRMCKCIWEKHSDSLGKIREDQLDRVFLEHMRSTQVSELRRRLVENNHITLDHGLEGVSIGDPLDSTYGRNGLWYMNPLSWSISNLFRVFKQCMTVRDDIMTTSVFQFERRLVKRNMITYSTELSDVQLALDLLINANKIKELSGDQGLYVLQTDRFRPIIVEDSIPRRIIRRPARRIYHHSDGLGIDHEWLNYFRSH